MGEARLTQKELKHSLCFVFQPFALKLSVAPDDKFESAYSDIPDPGFYQDFDQ